MFDLHVSAEVPLQVESAGAVRAFEGLAAGVEMHVTQEVVHSVKGFPTDLYDTKTGLKRQGMNRKVIYDLDAVESNTLCYTRTSTKYYTSNRRKFRTPAKRLMISSVFNPAGRDSKRSL